MNDEGDDRRGGCQTSIDRGRTISLEVNLHRRSLSVRDYLVGDLK